MLGAGFWAYERCGSFFGLFGFRRFVLLGVMGAGIGLVANSLLSLNGLQVEFLATSPVIPYRALIR